MPIILDPNPEETKTFRQMLREQGDWIAAYDPENDGDIDSWIKRVREQYED